MPLENPRHERFAQELAKGKSQLDAYVAAGYESNRSAASRLMDDVNICERVRQIQERAAIRTEITVHELATRLMSLADKGEALDEAAGFSVSRASLMDVAKLLGLVVDKTEMTGSMTVTQVELVGPSE